MLAICKREFMSLFQNVTGWLFVGINLALYGLYFFIYDISNGYPSISYPLSATTFIFLITVPVITMRVIAEDRKNKTDQLILTSSVSVGQIVVGKYLALVFTFLIELAVICLSPLFLNIFGEPSLGEAYLSIFGYMLFGLTCLSIGVLISSLTENQVISAVLTFVVLFIGYMMSGIVNAVSNSDGIVSKIFSCYDLTTPLDEFFNGQFSVTGLIYYITVIVLVLFLTCQSIQKRRWTFSANKVSASVFSIGGIVVAFAAVILINFGATKLPDDVKQIDCTSNKIYTITDETAKFLEGLDSDVTIYVASSKKDADENVAKTLKQFEKADKVTVEYVDITKNPSFFNEYSESLSRGSLVVKSGDVARAINYNDLFITEMDYSTYSERATGYDAEGQIVSAIQYVTSEERPVCYEITGHGETKLSGAFLNAFAKANYDLEEVSLLTLDSIPDDVAGIIINGPTADFVEEDAAKVIDYINRGGKVFIGIDYENNSKLTNFNSIIEAYGVSTLDGIVIENDRNHYYSSNLYLLPEIGYADVTQGLESYIFMPYSVALKYDADSEQGALITDVLTTTNESVSKEIPENGQISLEETLPGDVEGPFTLAVEIATNEAESNLFIFGSNLMFDDSADEVVSGNNLALFSNIIAEFNTDENNSTLIIPAKSYDLNYITFSAGAAVWYGLAWGVLLPIISIIVGIVIFIRRRVKY